MNQSVQDRLLAALQLHKAGQAAVAEQLYLGILDDQPAQPDAAHLLGVLAYQAGRHADAATWYRRALSHRPNFPEALLNLGAALLEAGDAPGAVAASEQALRLNPKLAAAQNNMCHALRLVGRIEDAIAAGNRAIALQPQYANAHNNLGLALSSAGRGADAVAAFERALELQPDHPEAARNLAAEWIEQRQYEPAVELLRRALARRADDARMLALLGAALHQLNRLDEAESTLRKAAESPSPPATTLVEWANVLQKLDRDPEAIAVYRQALESRPDYAEALFNLAKSLGELNEVDEALACCRRALSLQPDSLEGMVNLASLLWTVEAVDESIELCRRVLEKRPDMAQAWNVLAPSLHGAGDFEGARQACQRAVECDPTSVSARFNRGMFHLCQGNFAEGWADYDFRLEKKNWRHLMRLVTRPRWEGESLAGRRLLLIAEQGMGDGLQFVRYAPLLAAQGARVFVVAIKPLVGILSTCPGVESVTPLHEPWPEHDVYSPLMSLGRYLTPTPADIPAPIPYLSARPELVEYWRDELASLDGFRIAIAWRGNGGRHDFRRVPAECFSLLAAVPGVRLLSLQLDGADELIACRDRFETLDLSARIDREHGAFQDTAAIMMNVDLVVSSDTSVPHVAGALGRPVWLALRQLAEWRWLRDREDTPWYPHMRLFRQRARGNWLEVFQRMADELRPWVESKRGPEAANNAAHP